MQIWIDLLENFTRIIFVLTIMVTWTGLISKITILIIRSACRAIGKEETIFEKINEKFNKIFWRIIEKEKK